MCPWFTVNRLIYFYCLEVLMIERFMLMKNGHTLYFEGSLLLNDFEHTWVLLYMNGISKSQLEDETIEIADVHLTS